MNRGFRLLGTREAMAPVLAALHLLADVRGVLEEEGALQVWLAGGWPAGLDTRGVDVEPLPEDQRTWTGLEKDAPIQIDDDLLVRPPWVPRPAGFTGQELVVPRGGGFGSGEHGSTRAALRLLHRLFPGPAVACADVGTGSGILALYAWQRGARPVFACDLDPAAVAATRELVPGAQVWEGGPQALPGPCPTVVANLAGSELTECLEALLALWAPRTLLVLSGMLPGEVGPVVARVPAPVMGSEEVDGYCARAFGSRR